MIYITFRAIALLYTDINFHTITHFTQIGYLFIHCHPNLKIYASYNLNVQILLLISVCFILKFIQYTLTFKTVFPALIFLICVELRIKKA